MVKIKKDKKLIKKVDVKKWLNDENRIKIPEGANMFIKL